MKKIVDLEKWDEFYKEKTHRLIQYEHYDDGFGDAFDVVEYWLEDQPDAEEKHGKWIPESPYVWQCSACGELYAIGSWHPLDDSGMNYCWTCGARMNLGEEE